ncbi:MAG: alpha/beta hydrolase [Planctomycetota bacterium]
MRSLHRIFWVGALLFAVGCGCTASEGSLEKSSAKVNQAAEVAVTPDEWFLFFPTTYPDGNWEPEGLDYADVWFRAEDNTPLHAWYFEHPNPKAVVLYAHGNGGHLAHRGSLMQYLRDSLGVSVLIFDYRGYGRSEGVPTVIGVLQDARAARSKLAELASVKENQIVLMGRSLGGAIAADLTRDIVPRALILESTFSSFKDIAEVAAPNLSWLVPKDKLNSLDALQNYAGPLFQSHGNRDATIPFSLGKKLFAAAQGPKQFVVIAGGGHNTPQGWEYYSALNRFFASLED